MPETNAIIELLPTSYSALLPAINNATKFSLDNPLWIDTGSEFDNLVEHSTANNAVLK